MSCSVEGCDEPIKYLGMCGKHYKRHWRHGDVNKTAYLRFEAGMLCAVPECSRLARVYKYCNVHAARIRRHGSPSSLLTGLRENNNYNNQKHRLKAEFALGHPLPVKAVVHHHNGAPATLVICPDQGYHMLLHSRMRRMAREE